MFGVDAGEHGLAAAVAVTQGELQQVQQALWEAGGRKQAELYKTGNINTAVQEMSAQQNGFRFTSFMQIVTLAGSVHAVTPHLLAAGGCGAGTSWRAPPEKPRYPSLTPILSLQQEAQPEHRTAPYPRHSPPTHGPTFHTYSHVKTPL